MKVDLHIHTNLDPIDGKKGKNVVRYNYKEAIDKAKEKGLNAICLAHHNELIYIKEMKEYTF